MTPALGLYLHIPFCRQRCDYCAFYLELHREPAAEAFCRALETEIALYAAEPWFTGRQLASLYFGGGTPTVLTTDQLTGLLEAVRRTFSLSPACEITVEAHPATVTTRDLAALRDRGVTRISFGAESLADDELANLGRPGTQAETIGAVMSARSGGFTDFNLDLMYGLPGQTLESWERTLHRCIHLGPTHVSCYALTVEEGTRLAHEVRRAQKQEPDESLQIEMDRSAQDILGRAGYEQYEISNYARPGFQCRHNLLYWTQGEYLGVGPSAQSLVGNVRFGNVANLTRYKASLTESRFPVQERTLLTPQEQLRDAVIFGLRLRQGVPTSQLKAHVENYGHVETWRELRADQLIEDVGGRSRLSARGRLFADTIAERLF
jgi:oxygen-independent coproporphyrinogen-3 oxidase